MSSDQIKKMEEILTGMKKIWPGIVIYLSVSGILAIFIVSLAKSENVALQDINNWVGIILGLVATIMGIISLVLSFYNVEKANDLNIDNSKILDNMITLEENIEKRIIDFQSQTNMYIFRQQNKPIKQDVDASEKWEESHE